MQGHVYFIKNEHDGFIKMGYTERDPNIRLREWKHMIPHKLTLLGYIEANSSLENYLKNFLFYPYMVIPDDDIEETEWFTPARAILEFIEGKCVIPPNIFIAPTASNT